MRAITAAIMLLACGALLFLTWDAAWNALTDLPGRTEIEQASATAARTDAASRPAGTRPAAQPPAGTAPNAAAPASAPAPAVPSPTAPSAAAPSSGTPGDRVRFIDRDGIASVRVEGPLERAPAAPIAQAAPAPPSDEPDLYRLVVIESAGQIDVRSHKIHLAKVATPGVDTMCRNINGSEWPCGRRARTALRRLIRRRAIECFHTKLDADGMVVTDKEAPPPQKGEIRPAVCTVAHTDLSQWLIENGWAAPSETTPEPWLALHEEAKTAGLGLYDPSGR